MTEPFNASLGDQVINAAKRWLGTTYAWGGGDLSGPTKGIHDGGVADRFQDYLKVGFDCSGLTQYAWGQVGIDIGGDSTTQRATMQKIDAPQKGCVMWWPGHVSLYIDPQTMIEAPQSGDVVKISSFRSGATYLWPKNAAQATTANNVSTSPESTTNTSANSVLGSLGALTGVSAKATIVLALVVLVGVVVVFSQTGGD
jgi:hypothetical protein